jgi:hypothetical protein
MKTDLCWSNVNVIKLRGFFAGKCIVIAIEIEIEIEIEKI